MHLQIPVGWFWQLFTLQNRAGGLNLLTHPKSQFGWSICFFRVPSGRFANRDWQWHCFCWTTTWMKIVNKHHLFCWRTNCSTLNVHRHSANLLFFSSVDTSCIWVGTSFVLKRRTACVLQREVSPDKLEKKDLTILFLSFYSHLRNLCFLLHNPHLSAPTNTISL